MRYMNIYLKMTSLCNLECSHCFTEGTNKDNILLKVAPTVRFLQKFKENNPDIAGVSICFHGAEALLAPIEDLIKVYLFTKDIFPNTGYQFQTNLVHELTEDHIAFLSQFETIGSSWDYEMRFKEPWQLALWEKNLETLIEKGINVAITVCLSKQLVENVPPRDLLKMVKEYKLSGLMFQRLNAGTPSQLIPEEDQEIEFMKSMIQECVDNPEFDSSFISPYIPNLLSEDPEEHFCSTSVLTINPDETLSGCPNTYREPYSNIKDYLVDPSEFDQGQEEDFEKELKAKLKKKEGGNQDLNCYQVDDEAGDFFVRELRTFLRTLPLEDLRSLTNR